MSKNCSLPQPKALHVVITHASHRYMLCCLCVAFAARRDCYVLRCCALRLLRAVLAVCCAGYVLRLLCAVLATCCDCCVLRCCVIRLSIYILCAIRHYMPCCYIYCACYVLCWLCASSLYIYCVQFVTICLLRTQSRQKLCSCVKKKPPTRLNPAETVQPRKRKVGYARNPGRNFTAA